MKEYPILMSTPMIRAIMEGRKTQTRRIIKIPDLIAYPDRFVYQGNSNEFDIPRKAIPYDDRLYHSWILINSNGCSWVDCSRKPGDVLWVRETWMTAPNADIMPDEPYKYKASVSAQFLDEWERSWKPSIFMPKEACRIKLLVKDIQVERLQDITEEDAIAEGVQFNPKAPTSTTNKGAYAKLWESINGKGSWSKNQWVWKITFERILK
jgi:hypothetical protein